MGSVATLQVARDRLAGCSSWPLRFAVYSSGGNLGRGASCWQWGGFFAFPFRTVTSRELLAERGLGADHVIVWRWIQRYGPEMEQRLRRRLKPTNDSWRVDETYVRLRASGCIYTGLWTPPVRRSTSFCRLNAT